MKGGRLEAAKRLDQNRAVFRKWVKETDILRTIKGGIKEEDEEENMRFLRRVKGNTLRIRNEDISANIFNGSES